jgi:hypothetical protein
MTHSGFGCGFQPLACDGPFSLSPIPHSQIYFPLISPNETGLFHSLSKEKAKFILTLSAPLPIVST